MKRALIVLLIGSVAAMRAHRAESAPPAPSLCPATVTKGSPVARIAVSNRVRFVARIENPPRSKVTLSIDNEKGGHYELVWDPIANDGLQHEVLLPADPDGWTLTPSSEIERLLAESHVFSFVTRFGDAAPKGAGKEVVFASDSSVIKDGEEVGTADGPTITAACRAAQSQLPEMLLNKRRVTAIAKARGLLDTAAPEAVQQTLSILADIAVDRARAGAMSLVRDKFVEPICNHLTFGELGFSGANVRVLPRTCALAEQLQMQDVLAAGRALLRAVEVDIRESLAPRLIDELPRLNEQTKHIAKLALEFAARAVEGHMDGVVEIDYLVALFDQLPWSTGFDQDVGLIEAWVKATTADLRAAVVDAALPRDFDLPSVIDASVWNQFDECKPKDRHRTLTGAIAYLTADRDKCVAQVVKGLDLKTAWISIGIQHHLFTREQVLAAAFGRTSKPLFDWLSQRTWPAGGPQDLAAYVESMAGLGGRSLEAACGARLLVGVAKWCSSQDSCAAGEIAELVGSPAKVFMPSPSPSPWSICWKGNEYRMPAVKDRYIDLGVRLVGFLNPPRSGSERERILAMIRWMFDVVIEIGVDDDNGLLSRFHDVVRSIVERDYVNALTNSLDIAAAAHIAGDLPKSAKRALQLIGAVASYAQTYEETKTLDAAASREARRKALESLIDAATDRRGRSRDLVASLGSNVGVGVTFSQGFHDDQDWKWGEGAEVAVRVPFALSLQYLPNNEVGGFCRLLGLHGGVQLFDLGQFARATANDVTWATFVSPGLEAGFLIGEPHRAVNVSLHLSYAPALAHDVGPVWRYGVSVGYYVPFFDLN